MIAITLSQDELNTLIGLLDAGVKSTGLQNVKHAAAILIKIELAVEKANETNIKR